MQTYLWIGLGGALGAMARYWLTSNVNNWWQTSYPKSDVFPVGTLAVNLLGSFLMGVLYVVLIERLSLSPAWREMLMIGVLGAFTTFSTFSMDVVLLIGQGDFLKAALYMAMSLVICILAAYAAVGVMRTVFL